MKPSRRRSCRIHDEQGAGTPWRASTLPSRAQRVCIVQEIASCNSAGTLSITLWHQRQRCAKVLNFSSATPTVVADALFSSAQPSSSPRVRAFETRRVTQCILQHRGPHEEQEKGLFRGIPRSPLQSQAVNLCASASDP
ncbi:hypothetical protein MRX96_058252 [Rhipicephalus microplus]